MDERTMRESDKSEPRDCCRSHLIDFLFNHYVADSGVVTRQGGSYRSQLTAVRMQG